MMNRFSPLLLLLLLTLALACVQEGLDLDTWNAYRNPLVLEDVSNPDVLRDGDGWYLFSDGTAAEIIQVKSSADLVNWGELDPVFNPETKPSFISGGTVSSPSVLVSGDRVLLYYTLWKSASECGIGVASASSPAGPWTDHGAVVTAGSTGLTGLRDPFCFQADGGLTLALRADSGIYLVSLSSAGTEPVAEPVQVTDAALDTPVFFKEKDTWYFLASAGTRTAGAASTSVITIGSASAPAGPYGEWKSLIARSAKFAGPGSPARPVTDSEGQWWLLYNAYDLSNVTSGRTLMLDRLWWDGEDVPWVRGGVCSFYTNAPVIDLPTPAKE
jgi:arabinan endo-1,5-alpha-L-arabinosidase